MTFDPNKDYSVTETEAATMTAAFRASNPNDKLGAFLSKKTITDILNQPNCVGIRIYYGRNSSGDLTPVVTGALANEDDILPGIIAEDGEPSPPRTGSLNALNS